MDQTYALFADALAELRQLCQAKRTGNFFITTDRSHLAQFSLNQGDIVFLSFQGKLGADALPLMSEINRGRSRFVEGSVLTSKIPLPSTQDIFRYLGAAEKTSTSKGSIGYQGKKLAGSMKVLLEEELAEFIGPISSIICEEHLRSAHDLGSALETLKQVFQDPAQFAQFKDNVRKKLQIGTS
jgi:hypothetical protein